MFSGWLHFNILMLLRSVQPFFSFALEAKWAPLRSKLEGDEKKAFLKEPTKMIRRYLKENGYNVVGSGKISIRCYIVSVRWCAIAACGTLCCFVRVMNSSLYIYYLRVELY